MAQRKIDTTHKKTKPKAKKMKPHTQPKTDRSLWRGHISFGLVNIPVILYSAEKPAQEVHFKLLSKKDLASIKYVRVNENTGKKVAWEDIVKGYEYEPGSYVVLNDEDFDAVSVENQKTIEIEDFVDVNELGSLYFEKPYYVLPDKKGEKGYVLLRETLKNTHKIGIARLIIRTHQYLAAVIAEEDAILVNTLRYPQEIRKTSEVNVPHSPVKEYNISKKEFDIAKQLVDTMTVKWDPKKYTNQYRDELLKIIEQKVASGGKKAIKHAQAPEFVQTNVVDFMDLLKKSIQKKKNTKPESSKVKNTKPKKSKPKDK